MSRWAPQFHRECDGAYLTLQGGELKIRIGNDIRFWSLIDQRGGSLGPKSD